MPNEIPPPAPPPFPVAKDQDTEPGIGIDIEKLSLKRENMRLRQERNQARADLASLTETSSVPPPTRKQKAVKLGLTTAQITLVTSLAAVAIPIVEKKWPLYAELIRGIMQNLGWGQ